MKIQFPNNSPVIQGHWMIPRGGSTSLIHTADVQTDKRDWRRAIFFLHRCILLHDYCCESMPGWFTCSGRFWAHTHTHTRGSLITELERLVERRLFIGCLCLNWEQRWASDEDKTLSERVAFHAALVVIIITDVVVSYWLDRSTAKMTTFFLWKKVLWWL